MPGVEYDFVIRYRDRFIYTEIKYKTQYYLYTASSNKVSINVEPIMNYKWCAEDYKWDFKDEEQELGQLERFKVLFKSKYKIGHLNTEALMAALYQLQVGDTLMDLKKKYTLLSNEAKRKAVKKQKSKVNQFRNEELVVQEKKGTIRQEKKKTIRKPRFTINTVVEKDMPIAQFEKAFRNIFNIMSIEEDVFLEALNELPPRGVVWELAWLYKKHMRQKKETTKEKKEKQTDEYDIFCAFIGKPLIRKAFDSPKGVFDFIDVDVSLTMIMSDEKIHSLFERYRERISKDVINRIKSDAKYQKYNIPINYIKIDKITYNKTTRTLHYILSIKGNDDKK